MPKEEPKEEKTENAEGADKKDEAPKEDDKAANEGGDEEDEQGSLQCSADLH